MLCTVKLRALLLPLIFWAGPVLAAGASGQAVYQQHCALCHEQVSDRIPPRATLQKMPAARILRALNSGVMMSIGFSLSRPDRVAVASYLGTNAPVSGPPASAFCADRRVRLAARPRTAWNGWSPAADNARFQPADSARLSVEQVRRLKLKWAFGFAGDVIAFAPPTVIDGELFVGSAAGVVQAMRADSGCLQWVFQADGPVRSSILVVPFGTQHALLFGDMTGWFYALSAETGKLLWRVQADRQDAAQFTAGPVAYQGIVYVPVSSWEEARANDPAYSCCTFRGNVVALRIRDGTQLWRHWMIGVPVERGHSARGTVRYGPSGAAVWSRPTVDARRRLLYVATSDNYSAPPTDSGDAVMALDLGTGRLVWSRQMTTGDIFNGSCALDRDCGPDYDFGSSPILVHAPDGRDRLLAGQKSGIVWALDPANSGAILWHTRVGGGGTDGGIEWGMATDGRRVFAAVSDLERTRQNSQTDPRGFHVDPNVGGGLRALRVADGMQAWHVTAQPCPTGATVGCSPAQPGAVTEIPGVVFATSMDGHIRAYATDSGTLLWDFNTMRTFVTVDGVQGSGGSIDGPGAVVIDGMVFISSGYGRNGGVPGNVLLAFAPQ
ncbi:MAG TPA: PQQ-binding-like beta-propeller repeat protein [Steroidobacteraceae bacterium]|jgi:polyvinyl alcohol dehydrogenase (cytochrome)|nr:PQQ-binding-like beta-propeller repeat protein [Steroidobacteraceae bacterium]